MNTSKYKILWLTIFAIAMAYLEATVVVYLRQLYYPENVQAIFPLKIIDLLNWAVELGREAATVIMMVAVAFLVERKNRTGIFAAFVYQFGVWDIFYYIWLKVTIGWPVSWLEWDVLFLIPWAWLGPWICPALIALLFMVWGARVLCSDQEFVLSRLSLWLFVGGSVLALTSFLQPAVPVLLESGREGFQRFAPDNFWWGLFAAGYILMIVGLARNMIKKK